MVMDMVRAGAMYNKPKLRDPNKKPLILLVSTENQMTINLRTMYKKVMQVTAGTSPEVKDINPAEAAGHMRKIFMQNGWHFKMIQVIPSIFGFHELEELVLTLERDGYEIILMAVDYLGMCKSAGLTVSTIAGRDKQALFNCTRQLTMRHHYVMVTPHQFSTEALNIDRDRPRKFMEEVPNRQYFHDCKTIGQEVDVEILLHKIKIGDAEYLEVGRGKHRGVDDTPSSIVTLSVCLLIWVFPTTCSQVSALRLPWINYRMVLLAALTPTLNWTKRSHTPFPAFAGKGRALCGELGFDFVNDGSELVTWVQPVHHLVGFQ
jgi:hypothetical protein